MPSPGSLGVTRPSGGPCPENIGLPRLLILLVASTAATACSGSASAGDAGDDDAGADADADADADAGADADSDADAGSDGDADSDADGGVTSPERAAEPVVLTGADLPVLDGTAVEELFAFRYAAAGGWEQIPRQVDERSVVPLWKGATCPAGCELRYAFEGPEGDGLDDDDEVVFMARYAAERADGSSPDGVTTQGQEVVIHVPGSVHPFFWDDFDADDGTGYDPGILGGNGTHLLWIDDTDPATGGTPAQVRFYYWPVAGNAGSVGEAYFETVTAPLETIVGSYGEGPWP